MTWGIFGWFGLAVITVPVLLAVFHHWFTENGRVD